jgi:hypothetical protein
MKVNSTSTLYDGAQVKSHFLNSHNNKHLYCLVTQGGYKTVCPEMPPTILIFVGNVMCFSTTDAVFDITIVVSPHSHVTNNGVTI